MHGCVAPAYCSVNSKVSCQIAGGAPVPNADNLPGGREQPAHRGLAGAEHRVLQPGQRRKPCERMSSCKPFEPDRAAARASPRDETRLSGTWCRSRTRRHCKCIGYANRGIVLQGPFATAAELVAANAAGELTHCHSRWGDKGYDCSWASTVALSAPEAAAKAAAAATANLDEEADLEGGIAGGLFILDAASGCTLPCCTCRCQLGPAWPHGPPQRQLRNRRQQHT